MTAYTKASRSHFSGSDRCEGKSVFVRESNRELAGTADAVSVTAKSPKECVHKCTDHEG